MFFYLIVVFLHFFVTLWLLYNARWRFPVSPQVIFGCVFLPSLQILCKHVILETAVFGAFLPHSGPTVVRIHVVRPWPHGGAISLASKSVFDCVSHTHTHTTTLLLLFLILYHMHYKASNAKALSDNVCLRLVFCALCDSREGERRVGPGMWLRSHVVFNTHMLLFCDLFEQTTNMALILVLDVSS